MKSNGSKTMTLPGIVLMVLMVSLYLTGTAPWADSVLRVDNDHSSSFSVLGDEGNHDCLLQGIASACGTCPMCLLVPSIPTSSGVDESRNAVPRSDILANQLVLEARFRPPIFPPTA